MAANACPHVMAGPVLHVRAPAKLNLGLAVHGKRDDGFHALTSLVVGVELWDELRFAPVDRPGVTLECDACLPIGRENLVIQAAEALAARCAWPQGAHITLTKRIPVAGGLGGGSSDAAMTLLALNRLWNVGLSRRELAAIGAELGSDVPLFFAMPSAIITGRGETVTPAALAWHGWVALVNAPWPVSTREVYANWRRSDHRPDSETSVTALCAARSAAEMAALLFNELEPAVYRTVPAVEAYHRQLTQLTNMPWRLSGAGATAFALFDSEPEARRAAAAVESENPGRGVAVVRAVTGSVDDFMRRDNRWRFPKPE